MRKYKVAGTIFNSVVYLFLLLPLLVVIITSFGEGNRAVFPAHGFTLKWYVEALHNADFFESVFISLKIAVVSTLISAVLGTMVSLYFWKTKGRLKEIFELIFMAPMVVPTVVYAVAFLLAFSSWKFVVPYWKLVLSYCAIQIPYIIRSVTAALYGLDASTVTYPLRLYTHITEQFSPMVSAFSAVFILISFLVIYIIERIFGLSNMYQ